MEKILIVVDMQNDFINGALGTPEAEAIVPEVIEKISRFDGEILYTRDTHFENYMDTQEGKYLPVPHCIKGSHGWQLSAPVWAACSARNALGIDKPSFGSKDLPKILAEEYPDGLKSIELIGLCTDICVISNALLLKAFFPEVKISVDSSCCAGVTPQSHENALSAMKMCQIEIL